MQVEDERRHADQYKEQVREEGGPGVTVRVTGEGKKASQTCAVLPLKAQSSSWALAGLRVDTDKRNVPCAGPAGSSRLHPGTSVSASRGSANGTGRRGHVRSVCCLGSPALPLAPSALMRLVTADTGREGGLHSGSPSIPRLQDLATPRAVPGG